MYRNKSADARLYGLECIPLLSLLSTHRIIISNRKIYILHNVPERSFENYKVEHSQTKVKNKKGSSRVLVLYSADAYTLAIGLESR